MLAALAKRQRPYATILGCSDSRVPPELVFDAGFGEFVHHSGRWQCHLARGAGDAAIRGLHLRTPLFVVLGHEGCGAVNAALAARDGAREPARIALLLDNILPGLRDLPATLAEDAKMEAAVEANVRWSMHQLLETPEAKARQEEGVMRLVGGVYELESGRVRFLK
jgi:carbonic anhydrase